MADFLVAETPVVVWDPVPGARLVLVQNKSNPDAALGGNLYVSLGGGALDEGVARRQGLMLPPFACLSLSGDSVRVSVSAAADAGAQVQVEVQSL
jgi:hypothetical protein